MNLSDIQREYDAACEAFAAAGQVMAERDMQRYEARLRQAGIAASNAIEYGLKRYLESHPDDSVYDEYTRQDKPTLGYCTNFVIEHGLLDSPLRDRLDGFEKFRNKLSHKAYIPASDSVRDAIAIAFDLLTNHLDMHVHSLPSMPQAESNAQQMEELRRAYLGYLAKDLAYINLAGICAHADGEPIFLSIEQGVIPLRAVPKNARRQDESVEAPEPVDLAEVLSHPRVVLLGEPGEGKSTALRFIAYGIATNAEAWASVAHRMPIRVKAGDYAYALAKDNDLSFEDYITTRHQTKYSAVFDEAVKNGTALVLVDALDEVANDGTRKNVAEGISALALQNPGIRLVVTSRKVAYARNALPPDFATFEVAPLGETSREALAKCLFTAMKHGDPQGPTGRFLTSIGDNAAANELAGNPLFLTIMVVIHGRVGRIPEHRTDVYRLLVETMTERWPKMQERLDYKPLNVVALLEDVAFDMLETVDFELNTNDVIRQSALRDIVRRHAENQGFIRPFEIEEQCERLIKRVEEVTGLLVRRDPTSEGEPRYGFAHLSICEYLAATRAARLWKHGELWSAGFVLGPWWINALVLTAEILANDHATDVGRFFLELAPREPHEFIIYQLTQAIDVVEASANASAATRVHFMSLLAKGAVDEEDVDFWELAYRYLASRKFIVELSIHPALVDPPALRVRKALVALLSDSAKDEDYDSLFWGLWESEEAHEFFLAARRVPGATFDQIPTDETEDFLGMIGGPGGTYHVDHARSPLPNPPGLSFPVYGVSDLAQKGFQPVKGVFQVYVIVQDEFVKLEAPDIALAYSRESVFCNAFRTIPIFFVPDAHDVTVKLLQFGVGDGGFADRTRCLETLALRRVKRADAWGMQPEYADKIPFIETTAPKTADGILKGRVAEYLLGTVQKQRQLLDYSLHWGREEAFLLNDLSVSALRRIAEGPNADLATAAADLLARTGLNDVPSPPTPES